MTRNMAIGIGRSPRQQATTMFALLLLFRTVLFLTLVAALASWLSVATAVHHQQQQKGSEDNLYHQDSSVANNHQANTPLRRSLSASFTPYYRELYQYKAPSTLQTPSDEGTETKTTKNYCGSQPDFSKFFQLGHTERSRLNEDKVVYETFFKDIPIHELQSFKYVEIGGFDGKTESNSRLFEQCLGWEGLLVEANPKTFPKLVSNRPQAHLASFAASCSMEEAEKNATVQFLNVMATNAGQGNVKHRERLTKHGFVNVPCGSLSPLLIDLLGGHIHFFSLDVENAEPLVLQNLDFDAITIDIMIVESQNFQCTTNCESRDKSRQIMKNKGFLLFENVVQRSDLFVNPKSRFSSKIKEIQKSR